MIKTKDFDLVLDTKALKDDGTFEGYGSVFGNVDSYGEKVMPGAFKDSLKSNASSVVMLWNHDRHEPIGHWEGLKEDAKGLFGKGVFNLDVQRAKEIYSLLKSGAIKGLSIGYRLLKWEGDKDDPNVTLLTGIELKEISPVTFPANTSATITAVKGYDDFAARCRTGELSLKDIEDAMRDAFGFSRKEATAIVSHGFKTVTQGEPVATAEALSEMLNTLRKSA